MSIEWKRLTDGSFKGFRFHVALPDGDDIHGIANEEVVLERRLQQIERPNVDGNKVNDFGRKSEIYNAEIFFHGENYMDTYEAFKKVLAEGTPGILILPTQPVAVQAVFWKLSTTSDASAGNMKVVRCSWVEDVDDLDSPNKKSGLGDSKSLLDSALGAAQSILKNNPLVAAVRAFESGLSVARRASNTVLTLTDGVRARIKQLDANIKGTMNLIKAATNEVHALIQDPKSDLGFQFRRTPDGAFSIAASPSTAPTSPTSTSGYDPDTGQRIADFTEPDASLPPASPLERPDVAPDVDVRSAPITSDATLGTFTTQAIQQLKSDTDELLKLSGGRTDDVSASAQDVVNTLVDYVSTVSLPKSISVIVPLEMSLLEVLFFNDISIELVDDYHRKNPYIEDPMVVPRGTVVQL